MTIIVVSEAANDKNDAKMKITFPNSRHRVTINLFV
jgi:hypothetical protein